MNPETSVIIPMYNAEAYIEEAVNSIRKGAYKDYEIILVDDGSIDSTLRICEKICEEDGKVRVIEITHGGVSAARNVGLSEARGKYIAFVDADDYVTAEYLQILVDTAKEKNADYVGCGFKMLYLDNKGTKDMFVFPSDVSFDGKEARHNMGDRCLCTLPGCEYRLSSACMSVYKKDIIDEHKIRFREDIIYGEDTLFTYFFSHYIDSFSYIHKPIYYCRKHSDSSSATYYKDDFIDINSKFIDAVEETATYFGDSHRYALVSFKLLQIVDVVLQTVLEREKPNRTDFDKARKLLTNKCGNVSLTRYLHRAKEVLTLLLLKGNHYYLLLLLNSIRMMIDRFSS